jgi:hypothetical protein
MSNWNQPALADLYANFLDYLKARDVDTATLFLTDPTNQPTGAIRFSRSLNLFQEWNGTAWVNKVLAQAGGGTGAGSIPALGTMASQNANAVAITGGAISGLNSLGVNGTLSSGGGASFAGDIYAARLITPYNTGDVYCRGILRAGPIDRQITTSDGSVRAETISPSTFTGTGTKVLVDNGTWVLADDVGGGGVKEIIHNNFSFGTDETDKLITIPWTVNPPSTAFIDFRFNFSGIDWSSANSGDMLWFWEVVSVNQMAVHRKPGPSAVQPWQPATWPYVAIRYK